LGRGRRSRSCSVLAVKAAPDDLAVLGCRPKAAPPASECCSTKTAARSTVAGNTLVLVSPRAMNCCSWWRRSCSRSPKRAGSSFDRKSSTYCSWLGSGSPA
jgi:hypothetical protein